MLSSAVNRFSYVSIETGFSMFFMFLACIDNNSECAAWALDGECGQNAGYMLWKCPKACGWCQMAGVIAYPVQVKKFVDSTPIKLRELS